MRVLMVSTDYPPMRGGVGRYSERLVESLKKIGLQVFVVCNEKGDGDFGGLSPCNKDNPSIIRRAVKEFSPDLVHIQYEQGLYGMHLDPIIPLWTRTGIESFYEDCNIPIVTTFHSAYTFRQWMNLVVLLGNTKLRRFGTWSRMIYDYWTHLINYQSFCQLNRRKLGAKRAGIVFSKYLASLIPGSQLIYHGSERSLLDCPSKEEARKLFCIPEDSNVALASGFMTATKGWDIIRKMKVPDGWNIVVNTSKNHYNREIYQGRLNKQGVIQLDMGFLSEEQLSLLFQCADILILPYKVSSGSGVMFDGFAHRLPFISSNIEFFREFSEMGLGITVDRDPHEFSEALLEMEQNMNKYKKSVELFAKKIMWKQVALQHEIVYESLLTVKPYVLNKSVYIGS